MSSPSCAAGPIRRVGIASAANLNGTTLDVGLLNGFTPSDGQRFEIMATGGVTGMFTDPTIVDGTITFTAVIIGNDVFLNASITGAVPEPGSMVLLGLGLAGAGAMAARKSRAPRRK